MSDEPDMTRRRTLQSLTLPDADASRARFEARNARVIRRAAEKAATLAAKKRGARPVP